MIRCNNVWNCLNNSQLKLLPVCYLSCHLPILSETSLKKLPECQWNPCTQQTLYLTWMYTILKIIFNDYFNNCSLRIHWRYLAILKISKNVYEVMFFDLQKYLYSESVLNTLYIEIKTNFKKFLSDKINGTKNALFFLSQAPTQHSFTFN